MGDNVRLRHFGDCARLVRDTCNPTDVPPLTPYIGLEHIPENDLHLSDYGFAGDVASTKTKFKKEDILFGKLRPYFRKVIIAPFDGVCSTDIWVVRAKKEVDQKYLFYWMASHEFVDQATQGSEGTKMPRAKWEYISRFEQPVPSLPEQHFIAEVLGALDDKIELNRHMNATLESMARAVFKAWFVENEEAKGWKAGHLSDICNISIGGDWGEDDPFEGASKVACLRGVDLEKLRENGFSDAPFRWVKKASIEKRGLSKNDILIAGSGIGPVGRPLWVSPELLDLYGCPVIYSNFCKRFTAISPAHAVYIDRLFYEMRQSNEIWEYVNGTSIPNLDSDGLLNRCPIVIPPVDLLNAYYDFVKPIYSKLYSRESRTLAALRDALLPRLMGGEVRAKLEAQNEN